ncbi:excisionase family DNA-binding protein [uncultured Gimesia sp.]|uniref:excisionase family DNA-binding protein n=1 Tax=uncultured Gimesia sp. TaxID=1678688 RepID=UPI00261F68C0|nr:excisionase family DNA-binding protein [uncultured Gimesia sp.]
MANSLITPGQLELLADMIAERLAKQPRCIDKSELAEQIGISVSTIERLMGKGKIPFIKPGRRVLFDIEAVMAVLSKNNED